MSTEASTPAELNTFEAKVNTTIAAITKDDQGKFILPEGTDEAVAYAAKAELRRRDTQAAYTRGQQRMKALEAENEKLATSWEQDAVSKLSSQEQARLEELKVQDPEAWRQEITAIEEDKRNKFKEKRQAISQEATQLSEMERRVLQLEQFNKDNPNIQITDDVIENDIPPRITRKLEKGEIQFEEFLEEVKTYLGKEKKIYTGDVPSKEPNLSNARGGSKPTDAAYKQQNSNDYNQEIF